MDRTAKGIEVPAPVAARVTLTKSFELAVEPGTTVRIDAFDNNGEIPDDTSFRDVLNGNFSFTVITTSHSGGVPHSQAPV